MLFLLSGIIIQCHFLDVIIIQVIIVNVTTDEIVIGFFTKYYSVLFLLNIIQFYFY